MKVFEKSICLAMILAVLFSFTGFAAQCEDIPEHVLRLHVLANSDSQEDQTLKLQVRDRILQESAGMLDGVRNKEEAEQRIRETLPETIEISQSLRHPRLLQDNLRDPNQIRIPRFPPRKLPFVNLIPVDQRPADP